MSLSATGKTKPVTVIEIPSATSEATVTELKTTNLSFLLAMMNLRSGKCITRPTEAVIKIIGDEMKKFSEGEWVAGTISAESLFKEDWSVVADPEEIDSDSDPELDNF